MTCLKSVWNFSALLVLAASALILQTMAAGQGTGDGNAVFTSRSFRENFESIDTGWTLEGGDVNRKIHSHVRTAENAHSGQRSEKIVLVAGNGTHIYYSYAISRALVTDDLKMSVWLKSDRPGIQLLARVVFPRERDPDNLQLLGTLIPGTIYDQTGKWQRLELGRPDLGSERQARLLRASLNRDVDTREAYIDRVMLNVYGGPGASTVLIDDLEVSPVVTEGIRQAGAQLGQPGDSVQDPGVEINQDRLLVAGKPRLMRAIRAPGVSPAKLKEFGFNALAVDWPLDLKEIEEAVNSGLWLMPQLPLNFDDPDTKPPSISQVVGQLPFSESVLCWSVGMGLHSDATKPALGVVRELRGMTPRRPIAIDATGNFRGYSREVDMLGAHRLPLATAMGFREYRDWLTQRRYLARPGTYFFSWVQATGDTPDAGHVADTAGPDPDQLRLLTYTSLAAGCRGLAFWADELLGQPGPGRDRLLQLGLLNLELQLLEPYFASAGSATTVAVETTAPQVKRGPGAEVDDKRASFGGKSRLAGGFAPLQKREAAPLSDREDVQATLLRNDRGLVVIPIWYGKGAQFVPGQLAANDLSIIVPGIPDAAQAWQVTPADVRMVKRERVAGGTRLTLPEFDLSGIILLTNSTSTLEQLRRDIAKTAPFAALWSAELANSSVDKAKHVNGQLTALGHAQPDGFALLQTAEERLSASRRAMERGEFATCYNESQRALRAVRILEHAHWQDAVNTCTHQSNALRLTAPNSSPYAVSFATLPQHWQLMREVQANQFGANLIAGGDFESAETLAEDGWNQVTDADESLELKATLSAQDPHRGERSLHLQVQPKEGRELPASLDPMLAALVSKPIPVKAGDVLRIRFWLRIPSDVQGSAEGAIVYDSVGGAALAVTHAKPLEWKQYTLYRHATRPDTMTITIGLTGVGDIYVDDLIVERAIPAGPLTRENQSNRIRR
jgi:hypothetical protein